jgi:hypothetical protein
MIGVSTLVKYDEPVSSLSQFVIFISQFRNLWQGDDQQGLSDSQLADHNETIERCDQSLKKKKTAVADDHILLMSVI